MTERDQLDQQLSTPLPDVADSGFSSRVMTNVMAAEHRPSEVIGYVGWALLAGVVFAFLPIGQIEDVLVRVSWTLSNSPAFAVSFLIIMLTGLSVQNLPHTGR